LPLPLPEIFAEIMAERIGEQPFRRGGAHKNIKFAIVLDIFFEYFLHDFDLPDCVAETMAAQVKQYVFPWILSHLKMHFLSQTYEKLNISHN